MGRLTLCTCTILIFFTSCCSSERLGKEKQSMLRSFLQSSDSRDEIYCASSYIQRVGGPELPTLQPDKIEEWQLEEWQKYGKKLLEWLKAQDIEKVNEIEEGFEAFRLTWSPYYTDYRTTD